MSNTTILEQKEDIDVTISDASQAIQNPGKLVKINFILTGGGHSAEALSVAEMFGDRIEKSYIIFSGDFLTKAKLNGKGTVIEVTRSFQEVLRKNIFKQLMLFPNFISAIFQGIKALRQIDPDAVLTAGSGPAIPIMIAAKLIRKKVIYIESMARITTRSLTGIIAYYFLADQFYIQWPEQKLLYPRAIYEGRVF